jgi:hypothetical protein
VSVVYRVHNTNKIKTCDHCELITRLSQNCAELGLILSMAWIFVASQMFINNTKTFMMLHVCRFYTLLVPSREDNYFLSQGLVRSTETAESTRLLKYYGFAYSKYKNIF